MKKLVLLDADVIIDLHALGLFERILNGYEVQVTKTVLGEAREFKSGGKRTKIDIRDRIRVIEGIGVDHLKAIQREARDARLGIDPGELESIAYLTINEEIIFCTCDKAAIKLISFVNLEERSISIEKALRNIGYTVKNLYPRHWEKTFKGSVQDGKSLRIQLKKLTGG